MFHSDRIFGIQQVSDVKSLANKLYEHFWNECVGFQIGEYVFLNDSFSTEGVQEYAVFRISDGQFIQIESITVGWIDNIESLETALSDAMKSKLNMGSGRLKIEDSKTHHCYYCTEYGGNKDVSR